ncbi:MAG: hypothetical protein R2736_14675 [Solirubrobacterales bacterium]
MASATVGSSAAGSAWAMLPTTVPRWRIGGWATESSVSASSGSPSRTSAACSTVAWRVVAPIAIDPLSRRT